MIKHYEAFVKVVELGSFSKAAKELYLSQPTVTSSIKTLERELDVSLIDRSYKKLTLTTEGELTYEYAKKITNFSIKLKDAIKASSNSLSGNITLPSSTFGKAYILEEVIPKFLKDYPDLSFSIEIKSSIEIIDAIKNNEHSFGIVGDKSDKTLDYIELATHQLVLLTPKGYLKGKTEINVNELRTLPLIKRGQKSSTFKSFRTGLRELNQISSNFNYILEVDDLEFIKRMILKNVGCSVVNDSSIRKEERELFDVVKITDFNVSRDFFIALSKRHKPSYAEQKLIDYLMNYKHKKQP
jgi:DNA-binding transcriptional LysR family regulator